MSHLEKSIGDLSNEDIVNSILEDFHNDLTLNTTSNSETDGKTSLPKRKEPKIIELDSDSDSPIETPTNETNQLNTTLNEPTNETIQLKNTLNEPTNDKNQIKTTLNEPTNDNRNIQLESHQNQNNETNVPLRTSEKNETEDTNIPLNTSEKNESNKTNVLKPSENESDKSNFNTMSQEDVSKGVNINSDITDSISKEKGFDKEGGSIKGLNTNSDIMDINKEKDFDEEIDVSKNEEDDEDNLSENEGVDDSEMNKEEIKSYEESAIELKNQGNELFKQNLWRESLAKYNEALRKCPKTCSTTRAICHANRAAVYEKLDKTDKSIAACSRSLELNPSYVKVYTRRARLYQASDKLDEALADYQKILELDPTNKDAYVATKTLPQQINERNEKLKDEMLGKLKDLGNMILRPFGLSTNNFQMVQDPNSGGYSINFQQNAPPNSS